MLFLEFTAGEFLVRSCRSALQARIAAESRSYCKIFCNDRVIYTFLARKSRSQATMRWLFQAEFMTRQEVTQVRPRPCLSAGCLKYINYIC